MVQYLFDNDKALDVARSVATRGYFPNEPLLAIRENGKHVVVEGNRRLAALKALREPGLLEGTGRRQVERLSRNMDLSILDEVPVVIAPGRQATDRLVAGRHVGTSVMAWQAENRASFILDKLDEGYDNERLRDELGFDVADIQEARQTRAIADMARSIELPDDVREKVENPRAKLFSTLGRVFDSSVGREYLMVKPDSEHGLRGETTKKEFVKGLTRLVSDVALGRRNSRTLNNNEDIRKYFESWEPGELPAKKKGTFVPADVVTGTSVASDAEPKPKRRRTRRTNEKVLPKDFHVRYGSDRLAEIATELSKLSRKDFPNAGAVLLRVFLELAVIDYLKRSGRYDVLVERLRQRDDLPADGPRMKQLLPEITSVAKEQLPKAQGTTVAKALRYDKDAPFSIADLHSFVHQAADLPGERDIEQFWSRTEPLFRLMLEEPIETDG